MVRCGVEWSGVMWCGVVWSGVVWCCVVWSDVVWCGVEWCGVVWCNVVRCGVVWCGVNSVLRSVWKHPWNAPKLCQNCSSFGLKMTKRKYKGICAGFAKQPLPHLQYNAVILRQKNVMLIIFCRDDKWKAETFKKITNW